MRSQLLLVGLFVTSASLSGCFSIHSEEVEKRPLSGVPVVLEERGHGKIVHETTTFDSTGAPVRTTVERRTTP